MNILFKPFFFVRKKSLYHVNASKSVVLFYSESRQFYPKINNSGKYMPIDYKDCSKGKKFLIQAWRKSKHRGQIPIKVV